MKKWLAAVAASALLAGNSVSDTTSITVHVIGDSTVCNYAASAYPQTGWGQILGSFFDASKVTVNNVAIGGRSSKTFIQEGRLASLASSVKNGDFIFIQFGHNDRYFGSKDREVPFDSLSYYLQQYVDSAKAWGATPVFVSPMMMNTYPRDVFSTKYSTKSEYDVRDLMESLSQTNQIPFVDLNYKSYVAYGKTLNSSYVSRYLFKYFLAGEYPNYADGVTTDGTTHFQESGSVGHCQWIAEELGDELQNSTLSSEAKARLTLLVSALKPRFALTVKSNVSNSAGLISHNQELPGGVPLTLHVSQGSFGATFKYWADDDCNQVSTDSNYYGSTMPSRAITYTAVFDGGSACVASSHDAESSSSVAKSSSSSEISSSSIAQASSSSSFDSAICWNGGVESGWLSPIDMAYPDESDGTTDTDHAGYTGAGYYNIANSATSKAVYNVTSDQSASNAKLMIRYSNGGSASRPMKITVDNGTYAVDFPVTADWDTWATVTVENVWVDALDFKLSIESTTDEGGPNIDRIAFDIKNVYRTGCSPVEVEVSSSSAELSSSSEGSESLGAGNLAKSYALDLETMSFSVPTAGLARVRVFDALGHRVFVTERNVSAGSHFFGMESFHFAPGIYFADLSLDGGTVLRKTWRVR